MKQFLEMTGARLCPHGKTTMSPQLIRRQLADGAWGITAANARQMLMMRAAGARRVIIANQVVGRGELALLSSVLAQDPEFDLYVLVDSLELVTHVERHLRGVASRKLQVLLEIGQTGARTGARDLATALAVARAVAASEVLALRGVETFEGILHGENVANEEAKVEALYAATRAAAEACAAEGLFAPGPVILTGGGSLYYDVAARVLGTGLRASGGEINTCLVIRSGCYLTHDSGWLDGYYRRMRERAPSLTVTRPDPQAALEVWACVQSRPEPGLAFATMGKRDVSYDMDLPVPLWWYRPGESARPTKLRDHRVHALNDQHAYLTLPSDSPLAVGDLIGFGISHPCTTFDKWRLIPIVDDDYTVIDAVQTCF